MTAGGEVFASICGGTGEAHHRRAVPQAVEGAVLLYVNVVYNVNALCTPVPLGRVDLALSVAPRVGGRVRRRLLFSRDRLLARGQGALPAWPCRGLCLPGMSYSVIACLCGVRDSDALSQCFAEACDGTYLCTATDPPLSRLRREAGLGRLVPVNDAT
jgi:hypothetical protein